jgi:hypothetical protein
MHRRHAQLATEQDRRSDTGRIVAQRLRHEVRLRYLRGELGHGFKDCDPAVRMLRPDR